MRGALCERAGTVMPARARAVRCENLHLTLAYVGPVEEDRRAGVEAIGDAVAARSFLFTVDAVEVWRRKGIAWIGCRTAPAALATIVEQLRTGMRNAGIRPDDRPFAAHLTIARDARSSLRAAAIEPLDWPVHEFALMRSVAAPGGVRYESVRSWPLG